MKKTILILILLSFVGFGALRAQDYGTGIGIRGGPAQGITIKHFISNTNAIEGIVSTRWQGWIITGLYEIHADPFKVSELKVFYGAGAHIGWWYNPDAPWADAGGQYSIIGIDAILGMEYSFNEIPISLSIDWKPAFNLFGYTGGWFDGGGISVRYIF